MKKDILRKINKRKINWEERVINFLFGIGILGISFLLIKNLLSNFTPEVIKIFLWGIIFGLTYSIILFLMGGRK